MSDHAFADAAAAVARGRAAGDPPALAEALEALASAALKGAELPAAASALEEAGGLWLGLGRMDRAGSSLLLAAATWRLAQDPDAAQRVLERGLAAPLPDRLGDGFATEACEQALARGDAEKALACFRKLRDRLEETAEPLTRARLLERSAAAALACGRPRDGADDLLGAATLYTGHGAPADGEAAALAAAAVLADLDTGAAERIVAEIAAEPPADGAAAARRGLVSGRVAARAGNQRSALERFDGARQGALDCRDPISYLAAAAEGAAAAEACGLMEAAYERLATAWATLSDLMGPESARELVRPALQGLRDRLGAARFNAVRAAYEARRRADRADARG